MAPIVRRINYAIHQAPVVGKLDYAMQRIDRHQRWVVRMPVNVNPGLSVNCRIIFSCLKMFFTSNVWVSLRLIQLNTERYTREHLAKKLQN